MQSFQDKIAVITGGGTGMGRALAVQLAGEGCHVSFCDVSAENMAQTTALCRAANANVKVSSFVCDVANEEDMLAFREDVITQQQTQCINLLFNNAGIGGGGGFLTDERKDWERTFNVCWYGVYFGARTFMPLLVASTEGCIVNTSSVNGFWASLGSGISHTAYSAAKFAVKGFTEALITDLRLNAPHVRAAVVMPGHIGTSIALNTSKVLGKHSALEMTAEEIAAVRARLVKSGLPVSNLPDDQIRGLMHQQALDFRDKAPVTAEQAAAIILDGVRNKRWRILVGDDAHALDQAVRAAPELAYEADFFTQVRERGHFGFTERRS